jgi:glycosyltransferase involved in cell wall biosynthesis
MRFILLTGEYPPYHGGVADYTFQVAQGLRQRGIGVEVIVFREPRGPGSIGVNFVGSAVSPMSLRRASRILKRSSDDRILLVQYVPQMYGLKGMNLGFVLWLSQLRGSTIWVMFHEVYVATIRGASWKHRMLALITQNMAQRMAKKADQCFVSISSFIEIVKKSTRLGVQVEWLPVPSNLGGQGDQQEINRLRTRLLDSGPAALVGHFGTYGATLRPLIQQLVEQSRPLYPDWKFVFIGRGSRQFLNDLEEQGRLSPGTAVASGGLDPDEVACWIKACDVMIQPYPDGASTRRGTLMAALALGKATVSNLGHLSDPIWADSQSLYIVDRPVPGELVAAVATVLDDRGLQSRLEVAAARLYAEEFSLERTLRRLEAAVAGVTGILANSVTKQTAKKLARGVEP